MSVDASDLRAAIEQWAGDVQEAATLDLVDELRHRVPVGETTRLGEPRLQDTEEVHLDGLHSEIAYRAYHASFTDEGTEPHPIIGNPLLAFRWHGQLVIVHSVNHPGTTGTHWWSETMTVDGYLRALRDAAASSRFG